MPEAKRILLFYEGDDDKAVLEGFHQLGFLAGGCKIADRDKAAHQGKDGLVRQMAPFVLPEDGVGGSAVVLIDLDDKTATDLAAWLEKELGKHLKGGGTTVAVTTGPSGRVSLFRLTAGERVGRVALVAAGLAGDAAFGTEHGVDRFAIDDHVLRLAREPRVYAAVSELESVSYDLAMKKMGEIATLLRENGLEIRQTKRLLHILRAVAAVRPTSATFISRLMKKAKETLTTEEIRRLFSPLLDDLEEAIRLVEA